MLTEDLKLSRSDVQSLSGRDSVASFFLKLGYDVNRVQQTTEALGITNDTLARHIVHTERIADQDSLLQVFLFEMKSLRVTDRQTLARTFRDLNSEFLIVLTTPDYDQLDFVLLEHILPERAGDGIGRRYATVRPRVLTVDRQNPDSVSLRVLRRFTYTEGDPIAQHEKLLSAYTVAEWAEPLFNNRALFSDYFLTRRLEDAPEWQEEVVPVFRALQALMADARKQLPNEPEATTRADLLEPVFRTLGFTWQAGRESGQVGEEPDYLLYGGDDVHDQPLAACLAYVWSRNLDGVDYTRDSTTPDENPGAQVVTLLDRGDVPYVIVTNGKLWRLYAAAAHSRATNYYEIDLEETLASPERERAIRYFWLFFRRAAFVPQTVVRDGEMRELSFLDRVMEGSQSYAKELEDRLKDRIFDEIFPHFATGFIEHIRQARGRDATLAQDELDTIYQATLTFLYRLMFLLYAESRGLLPVREVHGYWEISLERLKTAIAQEGGVTLDQAPDRLRKAYRADSTALYDHLLGLFRVIDLGERDFNVPRYNGGLFRTDPDDNDRSPDAASARFLNAHKIPDRYLALGLDRLARDIDSKTQGLVMIDYKSLGVRQLGSIYEGLLEFKLRIASERMAIVEGRRTEEIVPYHQAKKGAILKTGRGRNATERTLTKGAVYLENTRQERKATGSYYTPDYIVKYIVEHTVGPVLEEKFEALRPRLREAEARYDAARKRAVSFRKQGMPTDDPEKVWNSDDMLRLAYDVLDIKVLDPAMGSGHFLVEAVDFITDRLITFLNKFPYNPVRAALTRTREAIVSGMNEQGVSIDVDRLTDVALLKRQVLKRCVYGVDLNHMAVELAKVSLWLDAFTLGAPLSFLDHHLRWGNSLIGAMAREADEELQSEDRGEQRRQFTLFGGPFAGLLRSAELMRGIGMLADATIEQAQESAHLFRQFEEAARPYKQLLDVFVIRHFSVKRADEFLRLYGAEVMTADLESSTLDTPYKQVLRERQRLYEQYRFFHWDLEFPEVFIDLDHAAWKENAGFDAVVGNPPWEKIDAKAPEKSYLQIAYERIHEGEINFFTLFLYTTSQLISTSGYSGLLVPNTWLINRFDAKLRAALLDDLLFSDIVYMCKQVFADAPDTIPVIIIAGKKSGESKNRSMVVKILNPDLLNRSRFLSTPLVQDTGDQDIWQHRQFHQISVYDTRQNWPALRALERKSLRLDSLAWASDGIYKSTVEKHKTPRQSRKDDKPVIESADQTSRYEIDWQGSCIPSSLWKSHMELHRGPKIILHAARKPTLARRLVAAFSQDEIFFSNRFILVKLTNDVIDPRFLLSILNSTSHNFYFKTRFPVTDVDAYMLHQLPIARIRSVTEPRLRGKLVDTSRDLYVRSLTNGYKDILAFIDEHMAAGRTDVIHDVLAFLAQQMIDLNKQKQAEVKRFLGWLEGQIGATIDDLSGKTFIQGYLGDYQKGEEHLPFAELYDRLHNNRSKIAANLTDRAFETRIRREYEGSLGVLLLIKEQLAHTDRLIDLIVYKLYGLTDEEIAIVEGRA